MVFILVHFVLHVFFTLFKRTQILFHLLFGEFTLLGFGPVILILFFLFGFFLFLVFFVLLLLLLILFLFFQQGFYQVFPRITVCRIQAQCIFPVVNTFFKFLLLYFSNTLVVICTLTGLVVGFGSVSYTHLRAHETDSYL